MKKNLWLLPLMGTLLFTACKKDDDDAVSGDSNSATTRTFKVTVENVASPKAHFASGVFDTPVGATMPGGAGPGNAFEFTFGAVDGQKLSFATMFVASNDLFYGPDGNGIELFNSGVPVDGDVTSQIILWDAGTEVNEMPGSGANQPMSQSGPNTGADENGLVQDIANVNDGFTYPATSATIQVTIDSLGNNLFTCRIENLAGSTTPLAPGVWVVHTDNDPLFAANTADSDQGLEALAEDGSAMQLGGYMNSVSGIASPFAPGVWAVHESGIKPIFTTNAPDAGLGLEALAEDGVAGDLGTALAATTGVLSSGVFMTPAGASMPGPIGPGASYEFNITASQGENLSLATMFIFSNDGFVAPADGGLPLWSGSSPISGDITSSFLLWDAGTEVNQYPGAGPSQPALGGPNNGTSESNNIVEIADSNDGFTYPAVADAVRITITPL